MLLRRGLPRLQATKQVEPSKPWEAMLSDQRGKVIIHEQILSDLGSLALFNPEITILGELYLSRCLPQGDPL